MSLLSLVKDERIVNINLEFHKILVILKNLVELAIHIIKKMGAIFERFTRMGTLVLSLVSLDLSPQ